MNADRLREERERGVKHGIWIAVEYLVVQRDEPVYADELIADAGITREEAIQLSKASGFRVRQVRKALRIFREEGPKP